MSLSIIATTSVGQQTGTSSRTFDKPAGLANGDLLCVAVRKQTSGSAGDLAVTGGSGTWARISAPYDSAAISTARANGVWAKTITDASVEPSTYTITDPNGANVRWCVIAFIVRSSTGAAVLVGENSGSYAGTSITNGRRVASYATARTGKAVALFGADFSSPNAHTPSSTPSGYTLIGAQASQEATSASRTYLWVGWNNCAPSAVADADMAWSTTPSGPAAQGVVLYEGGATALSVASATHAHTAGSPTLTQHHLLAPASAAHAHAATAPALTQHQVIAVSSALHTHQATSPALAAHAALSPASAVHGHIAGAPSLTQHHTLSPASASHAHAATSPTLTAHTVGSITPDSTAHAHAATAPALTQHHVLVAQDGTHAHAAGSPALTQHHVLEVASAWHQHVAIGPALNGPDTLPATGTLALAAPSAALTGTAPTATLTMAAPVTSLTLASAVATLEVT